MKRFITLDIGKKRTGVALVDDLARVATPIAVIAADTSSDKFISELVNIIDEWEPTAIIFGLPIDLKGNESIAAIDVKKRVNFLMSNVNRSRKANALEPLEYQYVDERLTTAQAERTMKDADMNAISRKRLRDALAAAVIAQSFIDTL